MRTFTFEQAQEAWMKRKAFCKRGTSTALIECVNSLLKVVLCGIGRKIAAALHGQRLKLRIHRIAITQPF